MHATIEQRCTTRQPLCARTSTSQRRKATRAKNAAGQQQALLYDFHDQLVPYDQAWNWQKQRVAELCDAATVDRRDTVFILQHPPVYTLGAGSSETHVKFDLHNPPHPLYRTERGGEVTYHGPGQLVVYPILDLTRHTQDLHWYLRGLEEVIIRALANTSGLQGQRIEGLTGVWVDGHKLAAIGVRARKWVTYHGLALNVSTALQPFSMITPCGISDRPVGSVRSALAAAAAEAEQSADVSLEDAIRLHEDVIQQQRASKLAASSSDSNQNTNGSSNSSSSSQHGVYDRQQQQQAPPPPPPPPPQQQQQQQQQQQEYGKDGLQEDLYSVSADPLIIEYRYALLEALEGVFGLQLQPATDQQLQQLLQQGSNASCTQ